MRRYPEAELQAAVCRFLAVAMTPPSRFFFCPNGGNLSRTQAGRFKAMGLTPGVPDLHFIWPGGYGVIELKAAKGRLDDKQVAFLGHVQECGHRWAVCRSVEQVESTLREWGVPLRGTIA